MKKQLKQLEEFQTKFKSTYNSTPTLLNEQISNLRFDLLEEENEEYLQACEEGDLVEVADALGDALYIVLGSIVSHGLQDKIEEIFDEIHNSNMSKLDENENPIINGENGHLNKSKPLGKILKSENYFKPDIKRILNNAHKNA